jgi:hypothetical protein
VDSAGHAWKSEAGFRTDAQRAVGLTRDAPEKSSSCTALARDRQTEGTSCLPPLRERWGLGLLLHILCVLTERREEPPFLGCHTLARGSGHG